MGRGGRPRGLAWVAPPVGTAGDAERSPVGDADAGSSAEALAYGSALPVGSWLAVGLTVSLGLAAGGPPPSFDLRLATSKATATTTAAPTPRASSIGKRRAVNSSGGADVWAEAEGFGCPKRASRLMFGMSTRRSSSMLSGRSTLSFSRHQGTVLSSSTGRSASVLGALGVSGRCLRIRSPNDRARKGGQPVSSSYRITPIA